MKKFSQQYFQIIKFKKHLKIQGVTSDIWQTQIIRKTHIVSQLSFYLFISFTYLFDFMLQFHGLWVFLLSLLKSPPLH